MHISLFGPCEPYACHTGNLCVCLCVRARTGEEPRQRLICLTNVAGVKFSNLPCTSPSPPPFFSLFPLSVSSCPRSLYTTFLFPSLLWFISPCQGHKLTFRLLLSKSKTPHTASSSKKKVFGKKKSKIHDIIVGKNDMNHYFPVSV